jgi:hypothetical protein
VNNRVKAPHDRGGGVGSWVVGYSADECRARTSMGFGDLGAGSLPIVVRPVACGQAAAPCERRRVASPDNRARTVPGGLISPPAGRCWHL